MQATLSIDHDALPLLRSSLAMKRQALELNLNRYKGRLAEFEAQFQMTSEAFAARFDAGEIGDEQDWFEWEFVLDAYRETERQLLLLASVDL